MKILEYQGDFAIIQLSRTELYLIADTFSKMADKETESRKGFFSSHAAQCNHLATTSVKAADNIFKKKKKLDLEE